MMTIEDLARRVTAIEARLDKIEDNNDQHHAENSERLDRIDAILNQIAGGLKVARVIYRFLWPAITAVLGFFAHKLGYIP